MVVVVDLFFSKIKITIIFHLIMKVICVYYLKDIFFKKIERREKLFGINLSLDNYN